MIRKEPETALKFPPNLIRSQEDIFKNLGRNDWVVVQYPGLASDKRKFKFVVDDLRAGRCVLINVLPRE